MSKRSLTLMSGRWSGRRASLRKFFTSSGSKKLSSRVTRSPSAKVTATMSNPNPNPNRSPNPSPNPNPKPNLGPRVDRHRRTEMVLILPSITR